VIIEESISFSAAGANGWVFDAVDAIRVFTTLSNKKDQKNHQYRYESASSIESHEYLKNKKSI